MNVPAKNSTDLHVSAHKSVENTWTLPVKKHPTQDEVKKVFFYRRGALYKWRSPKVKAARLVKAPGKGYKDVYAFGTSFREHRLIWILHYGDIPPECEIDHINGNRADNRIENLRLATRAQNQANAKLRKDNTSGYKGVSFHKKHGKWSANISVNGKVVWLGVYDTPEEAHGRYLQEAERLRGIYNPHSLTRSVRDGMATYRDGTEGW